MSTVSSYLTYLLAIDPGADQGWALYRDAKLCTCGLGVIPDQLGAGPGFPHTLVVEMPYIRPQVRGKADPNDLIVLAVRVGRILEQYRDVAEIRTPFPHQWKGSADKAHVEAALLPRLSGIERELLRRGWSGCAKGKQHNVTEAAALGLWAVGR